MITIDKKIPIPEGAGRGRPQRYPWAHMNGGDSIFADTKNLSAQACNWARLNQPEWKFSRARKVTAIVAGALLESNNN